ncbi:MAG: aromatic aminobenezylarsenical efflux permease ArsG family transporter [Candidatus Omnitrophota bacterium]
MDVVFVGVFSAFWLGILTSISPCPLATNIAAISFLSKKIIHPKKVLFSGFLYTAGRMLAYALVGFIIISSLLSVSVTANFLQRYMNKIFGPILIITGLFLLGVFKFTTPALVISEKHQQNLSDKGAAGAFILGFIFALVFCPVSAALFFGSLIPLALNNKLGLTFPFIYGIGTGLPVLIFAFLVALGVTNLSHWFHRLTKLEYYMKKITGIVFILVGLYYVGIYWLKIF